MTIQDAGLTRRSFLRLGLAVPVPLALAGASAGVLGNGLQRLSQGTAQAQTLPATPACSDGDDATPAETEGPYYKRDNPERTSLLEPGLGGTRLIVGGYALGRDCRPVARALVDFWQADAVGGYDNAGYRLRGHQFTDEAGRYYLETVVPGLYPGRTRHIHVKVQAPNQPVLTTQLYFPGEARNRTDRIFHEALLLPIQDAADAQVASFNFVLNLR